MARLQRRAAEFNAGMTTQMTERFSAGGATLVKLFGLPRAESDEFDPLRGSVGMVTQDGHLCRDTVRANLLYVRHDATEQELWQARLDTLVESLTDGLDIVVGDRGYRLSGVRAAEVILVMEGEQIVERGTHERLLAAVGRYAELHRTQFSSAPVTA